MLTNLKCLYIKTASALVRLMRAIWLLPIRCYRILMHLGFGLRLFFVKNRRKFQHWWIDLVFLLMDLVALPEVYESVCDFAKWNTRPLNDEEKKAAVSVFGSALHLDSIKVDDRARIGCKNRNIVYVSYFTINAWGKIRTETFIHELVHIWQFQQMGGAYITRALRAQKTKEGYNYGGVNKLRAAIEKRAMISEFNLEQQADIVSDYFAIREGLRPAWGTGKTNDLPVYEYFVRQIRGELPSVAN